jgi:hypothetical protein
VQIDLGERIVKCSSLTTAPYQFRSDPYWRDHLLFYENFHSDIGATHQTGWTGLAAPLTEMFGHLDAQTFLKHERGAAFELQ